MNNAIVLSIGFTAQILFSLRLIIQWITSEKKKEVTTPSIFWFFSLFGSILLFIYGDLRSDFAIMLGQGLNYFIYIRNLQLQNKWKKFPALIRIILYLFPLLITIYFFNNNELDIQQLFKNENIPFWLLSLGIISQITFNFRFIVQWIYSEKRKESHLPIIFWFLSFIGALLIIIYAIFRKDIVLFSGQMFGFIIYTRNIIIYYKNK